MKKYINPLLLGILVGLVIWLWFFRKPETVVVSETVYKTDTVYVNVPFEVLKPYYVQVPPKTVTIFVKDQKAIDSLTILLSEKDILIQGLNSQIVISQDFLKQFPHNPKLIELDLNIDTLSLSQLTTSGLVKEEKFPIDLGQFSYRWTNSGLSKSPFSSPPVKKPIQYFAGGGANLLYLSPYVEFSVEKEIQRIRLYSDVRVVLLKSEASSINLGLKYNLKK